jgi:3-oxoacyl-[acyl-carrier-protein] synthase II
VTGLGPVTPIGIGKASFLEGQHQGRSGVGRIRRFDTSALPCQIAAEIHDDLSSWVDPKESRRLDRFVKLALAAAALAVEDAGLSEADLASPRVGTLVGSGIGGMETWEEQSKIFHSRGADRVSPFFIPMMIANMASGQIAMRYRATGPSSTVVLACATGSAAIGEAARTIRLGEADLILVGGAEAAVTPMAIGGFGNMKALSTRNDQPQAASRPFTASRDGFVLGEGAGVLALEELEHARARGAHIYAEVVGYGSSADAYHITMPAPEGRGAQAAMRAALESASLAPEAIGYINAHGTSTPANDLTETQAIKAVFGDHSGKLAISSTKSMTGHLLGAAGAVEAIATIQAFESGVLPPTINYDDPDPELDLDFVPNRARAQQVEYGMSNSFAFGGQNAVVILRRWS